MTAVIDSDWTTPSISTVANMLENFKRASYLFGTLREPVGISILPVVRVLE